MAKNGGKLQLVLMVDIVQGSSSSVAYAIIPIIHPTPIKVLLTDLDNMTEFFDVIPLNSLSNKICILDIQMHIQSRILI